jgi:hypothetical protein
LTNGTRAATAKALNEYGLVPSVAENTGAIAVIGRLPKIRVVSGPDRSAAST